MTKIDEIRAKWAEHGEALRSAQDDDKVVTVPARRCEAQVREFLRGSPEDVAHLLGEVERLTKALADAKEHAEGAWSRLETIENDYPQEILIERASGNVQSALSAINEALKGGGP